MSAIANRKVLVVDDQKAVCDGVGKILSKRGCAVERAVDGRVAIEMLDREPFDLVVADLMMPRVSGMELLRYVKDRHPGVEVVMITGYASIDSAVEATKQGAAGYVPKPFTPEELGEVVEKALAKQAAEAARTPEEKQAETEPIDVDEPFSRQEVIAATSEAFVDTVDRTGVQAGNPSFCPKGEMECKKYVKTGVCKSECPIRARQMKARPKEMGLAARTPGVIDMDVPFNFDELAEATSVAYASMLTRSDYAVLSPDWERYAEGRDILVIEDEPVVSNSLRRILSRQGHRVDQALAPEAGLSKVDGKCYDLVLLDLRMPGMSGLEVLSEIKSRRPEQKVMIVTGYASIESAVEATRLGASHYIAKPFTPEELTRATNQVLEEVA